MVFAPAQKLSVSIVGTPIRYVTLQFRDRSGAASPCYRNRAEITVLHMCEQKPYPVVYHEHLNVLRRNHRSCVWTETLSGMVFVLVQKPSSRTLIVGYVSLRAKRAARERASERGRLSLLSRAAQAWLLASFSNQESLPAGWGHVRELSQILLVRLFNEPYCKKIKSCSFGEPARRSQTK